MSGDLRWVVHELLGFPRDVGYIASDVNLGERLREYVAALVEGVPEVECPACGATIRARMADAPKTETGADR